MPTTNPDDSRAPAGCASAGCARQATVTLLTAHRSGLRSLTRRCPRCAGRLAWHHLQRGHTVLLTPDHTPGPTRTPLR